METMADNNFIFFVKLSLGKIRNRRYLRIEYESYCMTHTAVNIWNALYANMYVIWAILSAFCGRNYF